MMAVRIFYGFISTVVAIALSILAFRSVYDLLMVSPNGKAPVVDYINIVIILLTTVTVIFSVAAIAMAILGFVGYRNLKQSAGRFAERQALLGIEEAFAEDGAAISHIEAEFQRDDGHFKPWMQSRIRVEVVELLPLIMDRMSSRAPEDGMAAGQPTDEGDVD